MTLESPLNTELRLSTETAALALRTLRNSTLNESVELVAFGDEDVYGVPRVYFDFDCGGSLGKTRLYAEPELT